jgi:tRNA(Ile)-lysidine synthase
MRLINGHRMFGLVGMKRDSEIPECQGIHGVHESGGLDTAGSHPVQSQESRQYTNYLAIETGGIRVYRPLLGFSKARLIATCKAVQMEWFEDHTNKDPTVTTRNAIRKMYSSHAMPTALTTPAILSLSEKFEMKSNDLLNEARSYLGKSMIQGFEPRTGTLTIRFPDLSSSRSRSDTGLIAALLLRQVITFVTPEEHVHLHSLHGAVERIFAAPSKKQHAAPAPPTAFTVSGVQFRPLLSAIQEGGGGRCPAANNCTWLISRQPYPSTHSNRPRIPIPPSTRRPSTTTTPPWALYDGRFWLRVHNRSTRQLAIRPFLKDDLAIFKHSLTKKEQERLRTVLRTLAPGDVRWTIPAIAVREPDGRERVLALPTLGIAVQDVETVVLWEVRYKKVDMDILKCWESTRGGGL